MARPVSQEMLQEFFVYTPHTGEFVWRKKKGRALAGDVAGAKGDQGYIVFGFAGATRKAHRMAWIYMHGEEPAGHIYHINRDKTDNRIDNLRVVDHAANRQNMGSPYKSSGTGVLGVSRCSKSSKWVAQIQVEGRKITIGRFDTVESASSAYMQHKLSVHPYFSA